MRTKIVPILLLFIWGCASPQRLTKDEWLERYKPETLEQGQAMAVLQGELVEAKGKVASLQSLDKIKVACAAGAVLSLFAAIFFKMKLLGGAGVAACLLGFCLAYAGTEVPQWLAYIGLAYSVIVGCCGGYILVRAFREVVAGGELFKVLDFRQSKYKEREHDAGRVLFADAQDIAQEHNSTKKLVKKVKEKTK